MVAGNCFMNFAIQEITPELAKSLLAINKGNRHLSKSHVAFFEAQLRRGEMKLTHQGIAIGKSGKLLDGQHRLQAIANTGIGVSLPVAYDVPDDSFSVLDTGRARTSSDVLSISGVQYHSCIAAAVKLFLLYQGAAHLNWTGSIVKQIGTIAAIQSEYASDQALWSLVGKIATTNTAPRVVAPAPAACVAYLAIKSYGYTSDYLCEFFRLMKEGVNLPAGSPVLAYRKRHLCYSDITRRDGGKVSQSRVADYIKLFNAVVTQQQLKIFKSYPFPPMPTLVHSSESVLF